MTKVIYHIGGNATKSYARAQELSKKLDKPINVEYKTVVEHVKVNPEQLEKVKAYFAKRRNA